MTLTFDLQRQAILEIRDDNHWSMDRLVSEIGTDAETLKRWLHGYRPENYEQNHRRKVMLEMVTTFLEEYQPSAPVPRLRLYTIKRGLSG